MKRYITTLENEIIPFDKVVSIKPNSSNSQYFLYSILGKLYTCDKENYKLFINWLTT